MALTPALADPLQRFLRAAEAGRAPLPPEPAEIATPPADDLVGLALLLEPYARHVVHKRDAREGDLYCGQPTLWGGFKLEHPDDETERLLSVTAYARHFAGRSARQQRYMLYPIRRVLLEQGGRLVCYCAPRLCHAQVLATWALGRPITLAMLENL
jgi:hypothetical protein